MALNPSQMITRDALEDFSIRYGNEQSDFIADEVFTPIVVPKEITKVYQYDTSNLRSGGTAKKDSSAEADEVDYGVFTTDRTLALHKLKASWDPNKTEQFDAAVADAEQDCSMVITDRLLIVKEIEMATLALTASNYPAALTTTLATDWTTSTTVETDIATARSAVKTACTKLPNAAALSWTSFEKLRASSKIITRTQYTDGIIAVDAFAEVLKKLLGVQFLHICAAQKNANVEGNATQTLTDIWDDSLLLYVKNTSVSKRQVRYGANYVWNQMYTHRWQDDRRGGPKGRVQFVEQGYSYLLAPGAVVSSSDTDFTAGYLMKNIT